MVLIKADISHGCTYPMCRSKTAAVRIGKEGYG